MGKNNQYLWRKVAINQVIFSDIIHFDQMPLPNLQVSSNKLAGDISSRLFNEQMHSVLFSKKIKQVLWIFSKATHIPDDNMAIIACTHGYPWGEWMDIQYISLQAHHKIDMAKKN
jgi:hypothetical protein